ncbi:hypothetical protein BC828DRAFT_381982 [Blastocladiella britannica]|nr:hypothetical protein BC828DRAFT_381982 [Blastocladiella britannica]
MLTSQHHNDGEAARLGNLRNSDTASSLPTGESRPLKSPMDADIEGNDSDDDHANSLDLTYTHTSDTRSSSTATTVPLSSRGGASGAASPPPVHTSSSQEQQHCGPARSRSLSISDPLDVQPLVMPSSPELARIMRDVRSAEEKWLETQGLDPCTSTTWSVGDFPGRNIQYHGIVVVDGDDDHVQRIRPHPVAAAPMQSTHTSMECHQAMADHYAGSSGSKRHVLFQPQDSGLVMDLPVVHHPPGSLAGLSQMMIEADPPFNVSPMVMPTESNDPSPTPWAHGSIRTRRTMGRGSEQPKSRSRLSQQQEQQEKDDDDEQQPPAQQSSESTSEGESDGDLNDTAHSTTFSSTSAAVRVNTASYTSSTASTTSKSDQAPIKARALVPRGPSAIAAAVATTATIACELSAYEDTAASLAHQFHSLPTMQRNGTVESLTSLGRSVTDLDSPPRRSALGPLVESPEDILDLPPQFGQRQQMVDSRSNGMTSSAMAITMNAIGPHGMALIAEAHNIVTISVLLSARLALDGPNRSPTVRGNRSSPPLTPLLPRGGGRFAAPRTSASSTRWIAAMVSIVTLYALVTWLAVAHSLEQVQAKRAARSRRGKNKRNNILSPDPMTTPLAMAVTQSRLFLWLLAMLTTLATPITSAVVARADWAVTGFMAFATGLAQFAAASSRAWSTPSYGPLIPSSTPDLSRKTATRRAKSGGSAPLVISVADLPLSPVSPVSPSKAADRASSDPLRRSAVGALALGFPPSRRRVALVEALGCVYSAHCAALEHGIGPLAFDDDNYHHQHTGSASAAPKVSPVDQPRLIQLVAEVLFCWILVQGGWIGSSSSSSDRAAGGKRDRRISLNVLREWVSRT